MMQFGCGPRSLKILVCSLFFFSLLLPQSLVKAQTKSLKLATYNVGLAYTFVPYAEERKPLLIEKLKDDSVSADVLCLQEVWKSDDQDLFMRELKQKYPYAHRLPSRQKITSSSPACRPWDLFGPKKLGTCLVSQCVKKKGDEFTNCVVETCREEMEDLKNKRPDCAGALFAQVGKSMSQGLVKILNPFQPVGLFAYEGSAGLLMLSKLPLKNTDALDLFDHSTSNRRAALYAQVEVGPGTPVNLACTHLTANLQRVIPYTGQDKSWQEENLYQINSIINWLKEKNPTEQNIEVMMGDFNCGEAYGNNIKGEFTKNCQEIKNNGFWNMMEQKPVEEISCSFCSHNRLNQLEQSNEKSKTQNYLIDHLWVRNVSSSSAHHAKIIFNEEVEKEVEGKNKKIKEKKKLHLSDHFGVYGEIFF